MDLPHPTDPSHPDFLATVVATSTDPGESGRAVRELWEQYAKPIAEQVRSRFRNCVEPDFVDNAFGFLWEKLTAGKYDWTRGSFKGWWRTVLTNLARDAWDSDKGELPLVPGIDPAAPADADGGEARLEALADRLGELRHALDEFATKKELRGKVNYYAFFLIELRRELVSRLRTSQLLPGLGKMSSQWESLRGESLRGGPQQGSSQQGAPPADSQVIGQLLPWHLEEERLACRADLIDLGELWDRLSPLVDGPPYDLGAEAVCAKVESKTGNAVSRDVWYNWKRHLRNKLTKLGFPKKWDDMF